MDNPVTPMAWMLWVWPGGLPVRLGEDAIRRGATAVSPDTQGGWGLRAWLKLADGSPDLSDPLTALAVSAADVEARTGAAIVAYLRWRASPEGPGPADHAAAVSFAAFCVERGDWRRK